MASLETSHQGQAAFLEALKSQRPNSASSDFRIICGDTTYNVHRFVLSLHSSYFKRMCESAFVEAESRQVTLHDDPPFAVKIMVDYFYSFQLNVKADELKQFQKKNSESRSTLKAYSWVFTIADKYGIDHLGTLVECCKVYLSVIPSRVSDEVLHYMIAGLLTTTKHAYSYGPASDHRLRKTIVQRWVADGNYLLRAVSKGDFDQLVAEAPEFASDLVEAMGGLTMKGKAESGK